LRDGPAPRLRGRPPRAGASGDLTRALARPATWAGRFRCAGHGCRRGRWWSGAEYGPGVEHDRAGGLLADLAAPPLGARCLGVASPAQVTVAAALVARLGAVDRCPAAHGFRVGAPPFAPDVRERRPHCRFPGCKTAGHKRTKRMNRTMLLTFALVRATGSWPVRAAGPGRARLTPAASLITTDRPPGRRMVQGRRDVGREPEHRADCAASSITMGYRITLSHALDQRPTCLK